MPEVCVKPRISDKITGWAQSVVVIAKSPELSRGLSLSLDGILNVINGTSLLLRASIETKGKLTGQSTPACKTMRWIQGDLSIPSEDDASMMMVEANGTRHQRLQEGC